MFRRIWQKIVRFFRRLFGWGTPTQRYRTASGKRSYLSSAAEQRQLEAPKPLENADYEFLFMQLLEGVSHGWQQQRVLKFVADLEGRTTEEQWVTWLRGFGERLLLSPASNQELAIRMLQLADIGCGELGEVAGEIGSNLLERLDIQQPLQQMQINPYGDAALPVAENPVSFFPVNGEDETWDENEPITIDRLWQLLQEDANLAAQMAEIFDVPSADPQAIIEAMINHGSVEGQSTTDNNVEDADEDANADADEDAEFWFNQGLHELRSSDFAGAIASFDRVVEIKPDNYEAWYNRGEAQRYLGRYQEAVASFDRAMAIKPDRHETWYNRGLALFELGRLEDAIASFDRAIEIKPDQYEVWYSRGFSLFSVGRYEDAIANYDRAIVIKPDLHEVWYNRAIVLSNLGRLEEAIASYDRAIEIKHDYYESWNNRGIVLKDLGRYEEAIASFDRTLAIKPDLYQTWINRGHAVATSVTHDPLLASMSAIAKQNPSLNQRGYDGQIASYQEALQYVSQNNQPEGWGKLHLFMGIAQYDRGRVDSKPREYWRKAVAEYQEALKTLTESAFPEFHLEVLQNLFKALLGLGETAEAAELKRRGSDLWRRLLKDPKPSETNKKQRALQFVPFQQLTVDLAVQSGQFVPALELAEKHKNACLTWLLDNWKDDIASPNWLEIQKLLNPRTAIIYWHLSPSALTTFILKHNAPEPIVLKENPVGEATNFPIRVVELENWIKDWQKQYQEYQRDAEKKNYTWRQELEAKLAHLGNIIDISDVIEELNDITQLILIPHRDLYRFPLHYLFPDNFTITYLPSAQIGLNLQNSDNLEINKASRLLSVESLNPDGLSSLLYAEIEASAITQMFDNPTRFTDTNATKEQVIAALSSQQDIFHFTGHASDNFSQPKHSALFLSGQDKFTLEEICQLPLSSYRVAYLSASETAIARNQTIVTEYVGLVSGLVRQGVSHVVSTLWTTPEDSSALLAIEFYRHLQANIPPAEALKQAQQWLRTVTYAELAQMYKNLSAQLYEYAPGVSEYLRFQAMFLEGNPDKINSPQPPYAHPYYWAGFIITGRY
ncbi:CHAT domain-containing protein [Aerosakkonema funiforme]|uniref:CHAT domain-containing protein n=1 Tax=Aerosakkonema funiforme TaxID=1246630 RepID=UPI0035B6B54D